MSELRKAVSIAVGLRELATYVPVDTRSVCPRCDQRCSILMTVAYAVVAGVKPNPAVEEMCGRCWIEEMRW